MTCEVVMPQWVKRMTMFSIQISLCQLLEMNGLPLSLERRLN